MRSDTMHVVFYSLAYEPTQRFYNFYRHSDEKENCEFIRDFYGMYVFYRDDDAPRCLVEYCTIHVCNISK